MCSSRNIHSQPEEGYWKFLGEEGLKSPSFERKLKMKRNSRGREGVWIFRASFAPRGVVKFHEF